MRDGALSVIACGASAVQAQSAYLTRIRQELDVPLRLLLTHSAERFVRAEALAFYADEVYTAGTAGLNPTEFARRSSALVVLPASANMLACAALGLAATPAQTVLLAAEQPALFFPSMNATMWAKPTTRRHVAALRAEGHSVVDPHEREVFEVWSRKVIVGPSLPPPELTAKIIKDWHRNG